MDNLYEIVNKVLSHKEEIVINDCDDPKDAITKISIDGATGSGITILYKRFFLVACW